MSFSIKPVLEYLFSLQRLGIKVGLEHTKNLLNEIGNPHKSLNFIHIAGTNGKGSTCALINDILMEAGLVVGLYTSPHLIRFNERIKINKKEISDHEIALFIKNNKRYIKKINTTFFETTTAMAFDYFYKNSVDIAIIETGLGGRLDSTNIISPLVCGITSISLDHSDILGDTVEKISMEKSGIIKKNIPVYIFEQNKNILKIIRKKAESINSPLKIIRKNELEILSISHQESSFNYKNYNIKLPLSGGHQIQNCALAIEISKFVLKSIDKKKLEKAIYGVLWPGRMEKLTGSNIYYDVAHNYDGVKALVKTTKNIHPGKNLIGLFCIKAEKNIEFICRILKKSFSMIIICRDKEKHLLELNILSDILKKEKIAFLKAKSVKRGVEILRNIINEDDVGIIFGSHYIATEVYAEF